MIDLNKLKEVVSLMSANDLSEVSFKQGEEHITIKRGAQAGTIVNHQPVIYNGGAPAGGQGVFASPTGGHGPASVAQPAPSVQAAPSAVPVVPKISIDSPMVGTYYSKPNPDAKGFVSVGQTVTKETVVCIIEAMKVFNEIKAEKDGVVDAILAKDGQAVEFGQKLFALR
jgi:acetyl-CoA carboxylase biotin carboxyl carrier protein